MEKKNKRLGVLGGTFSPIHKGHIFLAEYVRKHCGLEKVLLIPAGIPPHKLGMNILSGEHRLKMTQIAAEGKPGLEVSSIEIDSPEISYTFDTLTRLQEIYGADWEIFFITGTDELLGLHTWYRAKDLLARFGFIVGVRPGYEMDKVQKHMVELQEEFGAKIEIISLPAPNISASQVRELLGKGLGTSELLDEKVLSYIEEKGLYR